MDGRLALALDYQRNGRTREALMTLELQGLTPRDAFAMTDITQAIVLLEIFLGAGRASEIEDTVRMLSKNHVGIADLHIMAAECAALRGDHAQAMDDLAELSHAGLPLLYRSFARATTLLSGYAATKFVTPGGEEARDTRALTGILARLRELAPHVEPASQLLVIRGSGPDLPSSKLGLRARAALSLARRWSREDFSIRPTKPKELSMAITGTSPTPSNPTTQNPAPTTGTTTPTRLALVAGTLALAVWVGFAIYLLVRSNADEVEWTRVAWVFSSVEAVAFAAAGMLFGSTVNRQRAERAEAEAASKSKDAESGRALAAALKAEEPSVVQEGGAGGPRGLGGDEPDRAQDIASRHARLARELFP